MDEPLHTLTQQLKEAAFALGFVRAGIAPIEDLGVHAVQLRAWLSAGHHGTMAYLERTADVRCDPHHPGMLPSAQSVLVVAMPYGRGGSAVGPAPGRIARYAQGRDYHNVLGKRLRKLAGLLRESGYAARASVDTLPVLERAWAQRAGVGFIGKNACLIIPGIGSHVFLGAIVTSAALIPDAPMHERCGACRLCLDACPTSAFVGPRHLDARRCIAYLTIELRDSIPESLRTPMGDWLFGCDVCQDVCPFNRGHGVPAPTAFFEPERWERVSAEDLLTMDDAAFEAFAAGSPLQRPGRHGMARNAAIVLGNSGNKVHLPVLRSASQAHTSSMVRDAAAWAIRTIEEPDVP